jgi:hypothetical protein
VRLAPSAAPVPVVPTCAVPVPAQVGRLVGDDHQMADADIDLLVAAGAEVALRRLERMNHPDLDVVAYRGIRAHNNSAAVTANAATSNA